MAFGSLFLRFRILNLGRIVLLSARPEREGRRVRTAATRKREMVADRGDPRRWPQPPGMPGTPGPPGTPGIPGRDRRSRLVHGWFTAARHLDMFGGAAIIGGKAWFYCEISFYKKNLGRNRFREPGSRNLLGTCSTHPGIPS